MLLFNLFELGQLLGHNVQVNAFDGIIGNELGQGLRQSVQANALNGVLGEELGQLKVGSIKYNLQAQCQSPTSQRSNQSFVKELAKPT